MPQRRTTQLHLSFINISDLAGVGPGPGLGPAPGQETAPGQGIVLGRGTAGRGLPKRRGPTPGRGLVRRIGPDPELRKRLRRRGGRGQGLSPGMANLWASYKAIDSSNSMAN